MGWFKSHPSAPSTAHESQTHPIPMGTQNNAGRVGNCEYKLGHSKADKEGPQWITHG